MSKHPCRISRFVFIILCVLLPVAGLSQQAERKPIITLDLRLEKVLELLPEPPEEAQLQIDTLRETGLQTVRIAILPDQQRTIVPVVKITGDMAKLNETLKDPTSPLRIIATPVGDEGLYQFPTSEQDPLKLKLLRGNTMLAFVPVDIDRATLKNALAPAPLAFKPEHALVIDGQFPDKLGLDWFKPLVMQNLGVLGEGGKDENIDVGLGMMLDMFGGLLRPFQRTERITASVFMLASGHRVADWHQTYRDPKTAKAATDVFNQDSKAKRKLGRGIAKLAETAFRSKASQDGSTTKARLVWEQDKDEEMMQAFGRHIMGSLMDGGPMPSSEPVPTTNPVPRQDLSVPYDADELVAALKTAIPENTWSWSSTGLELDALKVPQSHLATATFEALAAETEDGVNVLKPPDEGRQPRQIKLSSTSSFLKMFDTDRAKGRATTGRGRFNVSVPEQATLVTVPSGTEANTAFPAGAATLTIEQIENDVAQLSVEGGKLGVIQALDVEGQALGWTSSSSDGDSKTIQYRGTIDRLEVMVLSEETREVPIDVDVTFGDIEEWDGRERFAKASSKPTIYAPLAATDLDQLEVTYTPKSDTAPKAFLDVPISKEGTDFKVSYEVKGFAEGPVKIDYPPREGTRTFFNAAMEGCGLIHGKATVKATVGAQYLEVAKGAADGPVEFEMNGEKGTVLFDKNKVWLLKYPKNAQCVIIEYLNAEGLPLRHDMFDLEGCFGIPTKVRLRAWEKRFEKLLPFEFEIGPYNKEALAAETFSNYIKPSPNPVSTAAQIEKVDLGQPYSPEAFTERLKIEVPKVTSLGTYESRRKTDPYATYSVDFLKFPDAHLANGWAEVLSAHNTNGVDILRTGGRLPVSNGGGRQNMAQRQLVFGVNLQPDKGDAEKARIKFSFDIPEQKELITIPAGTEPGETFTAGPFTLTCALMKNDVAELRLSGGTYGQIQALDKEGRALRINKGGPSAYREGGEKAVRYHGTIDQLHVVVTSEKTREVSFETEVFFDEKVYADQERFLNLERIAPAYASVPAGTFENVSVSFAAKDPDKRIHYDRLMLDCPSKFADVQMTVKLHTMGTKGAFKSYRLRRGEEHLSLTLNQQISYAGLLFGEIDIKSRTGGRLIEVVKTTDGAAVPFEVDGKQGEVTFNGKKVEITRYPAGTWCTIRLYRNADGIPLAHRSSFGKLSTYGTPNAVQIYATTGCEDVTLPFEIDLGRPYDKAALKKYKEELAAKKPTSSSRDPAFEPSPEPVPTTSPVEPAKGPLPPFDRDTLAGQLAEEINHQLWFDSMGTRYGKPTASVSLRNFQSDSRYAPYLSASFMPTSVVTSNGVNILVAPEGRDGKPYVPKPVKLVNQSGMTLGFQYENDKPAPVKGTGTLNLKIPVHAESLTIPGDITCPKTYLLGFSELTVHKLENDIVHFTVDGASLPYLQAFDKEGNALSLNTLKTDPRSRRTDYVSNQIVYRRVNGQIDKLQLTVMAARTVDVPIEIDAAFKRLSREEAVAQGKEKFRYGNVTRLDSVNRDVFDSLEVIYTPAKEHKSRSNVIELPVPNNENSYVSYTFFAFGKDAPAKLTGRTRSGIMGLSGNIDECAVLFGEATARITIGAQYIEVTKSADGQAVPFSCRTESGETVTGEVTFDKDTVTMTKTPEGLKGRILRIENSKGNALLRQGDKCWGIPVKALVNVDHGVAERTIPFEIKLKDFDQDAFDRYKNRTKLIAAIDTINRAASYSQFGAHALASLHYVHDREGKPQDLIPVEIAHADPIGAKIFGYEAKPYLGYYIVSCATKEQNDQPAHRMREMKGTWKGGELTLESAALRIYNLVPVDASQPTFHVNKGFNGRYEKVLGESSGDDINRVAPSMGKDSGWKMLN